MKVLITGTEGFVGKNLLEYLEGKRFSLLAPKQAELDLTQTDAVEKFFDAHGDIERVVHCATVLRDGTAYPPDTCERNLKMFFNLYRQCHAGIRILTLGSGSEYDRGHWHRKMREEFFDRHVPQDGHSYSKYLISKFILECEADNAVCLRIFGIYGKYEDYRFKFISNAIVKNLLQMPITINKNVVYDYIYIEDFCRVVERLLHKWPSKRAMNVTPFDPIDLVSIAEAINRVSAAPSDIVVLNDGIGVEYSGSNERLISEIGPFRFSDPRDAIEALYGYYRERMDRLDHSFIRRDPYLDYAKKLNDTYFG